MDSKNDPNLVQPTGLVDNSGEANVKDATKFDPSGAPIQDSADVDPKHPAVDNNPRAFTTVNQNRIDFNDPNLTGAEAVLENLKAQGGKLVATHDEDGKLIEKK